MAPERSTAALTYLPDLPLSDLSPTKLGPAPSCPGSRVDCHWPPVLYCYILRVALLGMLRVGFFLLLIQCFVVFWKIIIDRYRTGTVDCKT